MICGAGPSCDLTNPGSGLADATPVNPRIDADTAASADVTRTASDLLIMITKLGNHRWRGIGVSLAATRTVVTVRSQRSGDTGLLVSEALVPAVGHQVAHPVQRVPD